VTHATIEGIARPPYPIIRPASTFCARNPPHTCMGSLYVPSCRPLFCAPNVSQKIETIRCDKLASASKTHHSFPPQPILAVAISLYLGKLRLFFRPNQVLMLVLPGGVFTLVGLTIRDYVGEAVLSAPPHSRIPSEILTPNSCPGLQRAPRMLRRQRPRHHRRLLVSLRCIITLRPRTQLAHVQDRARHH
jgi:hypothetical protein